MKADDFIDITKVVCPITFVKVKVALESLTDGQILEVKLNDGEALQNVPRSVKDEGHKIIEVNQNNDGTFTLFVEKGGLK